MLESIRDSFARVDIPEVVRLLDKRFGENTYSLRSLFRDEQRRILKVILSGPLPKLRPHTCSFTSITAR